MRPFLPRLMVLTQQAATLLVPAGDVILVEAKRDVVLCCSQEDFTVGRLCSIGTDCFWVWETSSPSFHFRHKQLPVCLPEVSFLDWFASYQLYQ